MDSKYIPWDGGYSWLDVIRFVVVSLVRVNLVRYFFVVQRVLVEGVPFRRVTNWFVTFEPFVLVSVHPYGIRALYTVLVRIWYATRSSYKFRVRRSFNTNELNYNKNYVSRSWTGVSRDKINGRTLIIRISIVRTHLNYVSCNVCVFECVILACKSSNII